MASGDGFKWSRNLREEHVTEANRVRLIERQKQLLESKRQRQPQVTASSRSSDRLMDSEEGRNELHGLLNQSLSPEKELPAESQPLQQQQDELQPPQDQDPFSSGDNLSDVVGDSSAEEAGGSPSSEKQEEDPVRSQAPNPLTTILSSSELFEFATEAVCANQIFQCTIIRDKRGIDRSLYPTYFMYLQMIIGCGGGGSGSSSDTMGQEAREKVMRHLPASENPEAGTTRATRQVFLLCGRRRKKSKTYLIGLDPFDISRINCVAKLKSNVIGTQFRAVRVGRSGQRSEEASIIYVSCKRCLNKEDDNMLRIQDTNVLGFKGPRKMTAFIPKRSEAPGEYAAAFDSYKRNKSLIQLKNKTPVWNEDSQSYVLNFHGRVTQASVKNFQLIASDSTDDSISWDTENHKLDQKSADFASTLPAPSGASAARPLDPGVCLQFGRVSDKEFTCDITFPLSPLQAFAIALSSFDSKLACE